MPSISIDGFNIFYAQIGRGNRNPNPETIVFVHGAGGNHKYWSHQLKGLGEEFITIAPDLPGHGKSKGNPLNYINGYSSFMHKFVNSIIDRKIYLVGHSMGGAVAMDFALMYPQKLKGLILIGTGSCLKVAPQILETLSSGKHFLDLAKWFYRSNSPQTLVDLARKEIISINPLVWLADFTACNNFNLSSELEQIKVPTLVIGAGEDMLTPLRLSKQLVTNLPRARLEIINNAGHMMMLEEPEQVNRAIKNFIREELTFGKQN